MTDPNPPSEQLSAYLDGELTPDETQAVQDALARDPALAAELDALRATRSLLQKLPRQQPAENFAQNVLHHARHQGLLGTRRNRRFHRPLGLRWQVWASAAIVLLAVCIGLLVIVPGLQQQQQPRRLATTTETDTTPVAPPAETEPVSLAMREDDTETRSEENTLPQPVTTEPTTEIAAATRPQADAGRPRPKPTLRRALAAAPSAAPPAEAPAPPKDSSQGLETLAHNADSRQVVYTTDLPAAQRQLESLFARNDIQLLPPPKPSAAGHPLPQQNLLANQAANLNAFGLAPDGASPEVRYLVVGPNAQLHALQLQIQHQQTDRLEPSRVRIRKVLADAARPRTAPAPTQPARGATSAPNDAPTEPGSMIVILRLREPAPGAEAHPAEPPRTQPDASP